MTKLHLSLTDTDRQHLCRLVAKHRLPVNIFRRATALLALDAGQTLGQAATAARTNRYSVAQWRDRYQREGLAVLQDKPRTGRPAQINGRQRAQITALACSQPPQGHARWSLRLLANQVVELGYVEAISHTQVAQILKKTNCSRI